ncbi:MAG: hypothetical protein VYA46_07375, partial [Verrucomicrobiota bacterium]|nr:hypothetical protein [Verrucomicrobiota bacterium]
MMRLAFILLTLAPVLTAQEEGTPDNLPWHALAAGLPPGTIAGPPTSLTIHNRTDQPLKIFWVKYDGTLKAYGELEAGGTREQKTTA